MVPAIGIQITTRCNLNCAHCYVDARGDDIPLALVERITAYAKAAGRPHVDFTGGEPFLHPRFPDILNAVAERGLYFSLVSNGWAFADACRLLQPHLKRIMRIDFSLDGATEAVHDAARRAGSYRHLLRAASVCKGMGIPFGFRTTVTQRNLGQLEEIALLAAKLGAGEVAFIPLLPTPRAAAEKLLLAPDDLRAIVTEGQRLAAIFKIKITLTAGYPVADAVTPCLALAGLALFVKATGEVSFCCHLAASADASRGPEVIGNLNEMSVEEAYQRMTTAVAEFKKEKARRMKENQLGPLDRFPCWYCLKYFHKVGWMADLPDNPWSRDVRGHAPVAPGPQFLARKPQVLTTLLPDGGAALVHPGAKLPHALNRSGVLLWRLLERDCSVEQMAAKLHETFAIASEIAHEDADTFVREMLACGLITRAD